MPCIYETTDESLAKTNQRLSEVTRLFCETMQLVEANPEMLDKCSFGTRAWWEEHKRKDAVRLERELKEQARQESKAEVIAKLTPYERSLLGIN